MHGAECARVEDRRGEAVRAKRGGHTGKGRRLNPGRCHSQIVAALNADLRTMWKDEDTFYQRFEMKAEAILKKASLEEEDYVYARLRDMLHNADIPARPDFR